MLGLELSRLFYEECIKQFLYEEYADYIPRVAVGLVGEGSECYGYDDELSRDHDWGATVCLWLIQEDYKQIGEELTKRLLELPNIFQGYPVHWIPGRTGVLEISSFFRKYLNVPRKLQTVKEWLTVPEAYLSTASNGDVFFDPSGYFSEIWNDLRLGYPEDIRLKKIAARCMEAGQAGQYNYPRMKRRGDSVAMELAIAEFTKAVISIAYLLNNRYTPFYKWMNQGLMRLPILGQELSEQLRLLLQSDNKESKAEIICHTLTEEFHRQGISDEADNYMVSQGKSVHNHIELDALRMTDPWMKRIGETYVS